MRLPDTSAVERRATRGLTRARLSDTYEVFGTENREQAIALAPKHRPDVVLLDLMMPKFSGLPAVPELPCSHLKEVPLLPCS